MKKVVIAGSASLQEKVQYWRNIWEIKGYDVVNYPAPIPQESFMGLYPIVHANFFRDMTEADILFVMNEDKNGITGYIWAETFAELTFGVAQNLIYGKRIEIVLLKMPEERVQSCQEIELWLKLGWIKLYSE